MNDSTAKITNLINFHGITLRVIHFNNVDYIPAKPLVDLAGIDWRNAKKALFDEENQLLYATQRLKIANIAYVGGDITPQRDTETLCIRLDRARIFLARINTNRMKAHGNVEAAKKLLQLQIEWAQALHDYETKGYAVKKDDLIQSRHLMQLVKTYETIKDPENKALIKAQIEALTGAPLKPSKQPDMFS